MPWTCIDVDKTMLRESASKRVTTVRLSLRIPDVSFSIFSVHLRARYYPLVMEKPILFFYFLPLLMFLSIALMNLVPRRYQWHWRCVLT